MNKPPQVNIGDLVEVLSPKMERIGIIGIVVGENVKVGFWDGDIECRQLSVLHAESSSSLNKIVCTVNEKYIARIE